MTKTTRAVAALCGVLSTLEAADFKLHTFRTIRMTDEFWAEGAHFGDFNKDGHGDVVSGPYWYEGPLFEKRHEFYPATKTSTRKDNDGKETTFAGYSGALGAINDYSENFLAFTHDFNRDGWDDILVYGFPGKEAAWYENPQGRAGHWPRHIVFGVVDNESPAWVDLTGDGKPEIVCNSGGYFGYVSPNWASPQSSWTFHPISPKGDWQRFTHGLGVGDVNGDGRADVLDKDGWWEQPATLDGDPVWARHETYFGTGGAQMYTYDFNGDGLPDVLTSIAAHGYGLSWFEQYRDGGTIQFRERRIMNKEPEENTYGVRFSQLHAIDVVDMDGDGLRDIITGKRFWAHGPTGDAEPNAPAVLYWFKLTRGKNGAVDFIPHQIHDDSGVGTQVVAGDVNGDGLPDVVVGNKKGTFAHLQQVRVVSREDWEKGQPKPPQGASAKASVQSASRGGVRPTDRDGRPLNLDFEDGTLRDWRAQGNAFDGQPMQGDKVVKRRADMRSQHTGNYWLGTYEVHQDAARGTLTSAPFTVTHPYASFLVAGGPYENTRVELALADTGEVFFKISGFDGEVFKQSNDASEALRPVLVDLAKVQNRDIFVRIVDQEDGHWAHINFDDFQFHAEKPDLANALNPKQPSILGTAPEDQIRHAGLTPAEAVREMELPAGFSATLFAGEPDVRQPIAFALDDRGRLWVAEAYTYPAKAPEGEGKDRILILEDTDGDGQFNRRTVFVEGLNLVSGLEVGFGGVWVGAAPYLLFIPDKNGDDKPDGEPEIRLDGWAWQDTHETLNTFTWGPDGWLYGCHGVFTHSNVGKPGAPDSERIRLNAGIWRFHPLRLEFEVFAEGTSNPWGIDFDERGQCFIEACVIPHLYHVIQGACYQRQAGQHFNAYAYDDIKTIADHVHYAGDRGPHAGNNRSGLAGGGHAHAGLMVYQGDSWPERFRGKIFMNNIHGARINMDIIEPLGSGFVGRHGADFILFHDRWSQVLNLQSDQDGSVYVLDWYDENQCHHGRYAGHDRSNGRIFKVVYQNEEWTRVNLAALSDAELVQLQSHPNDWHARHARRLLQERGSNAAVHQALRGMFDESKEPTLRLRLLWTLHVTEGLDESFQLSLLSDSDEHTRAWVLQLAWEDRQASPALLERMADLARNDRSPVVRLYLAAALQRASLEDRRPILEPLLARAEDAGDHNLPLMYWYAAEPLVGRDTASAIAILGKTKIPRVREWIAKRMAISTSAKSASLN